MKASERRLLTILGVLASVCAAALLSQRLLGKQRALDQREHAMELQQAEADALLAEAPLWSARLDWLKTNQPAMTSENQASQDLLDELVATTSANHLTVQKKQLHEAAQQSFYNEVGVTITVQGDLPDLFRWLHGLLSPESFRLVSQLRITPDAKDQSKIVATLRINRRHSPAIATTTSASKEEGAGQ
jgi:Tfp pilus assembly protein PilO